MKKTIWIGVLLVAVAALAVVVVRQNRQTAELKEQLAVATTVAERAKEQALATLKRRRLPEPLPATSLAEPAPAPVVPATAAPSTGATSNFFAGLAGMMKDPHMKEMMRTQQKMGLDRMYGPLSKYLTLPAEKLDALKELLADRQMALTEAGMAMMHGSEADRKQAADAAKAVKADYDKQIQELLGSQDYETFTAYEQSVGERMQVQMFKDALPASAALTEQQEFDLISAMYEERKALPASSLLNNKTPDPSQLTEESIVAAVKQMEQLQARYAARAATILAPAQLEQFTKWQQQMSAMQTMGLKMAAQMFGNKPAPPPAETR